MIGYLLVSNDTCFILKAPLQSIYTWITETLPIVLTQKIANGWLLSVYEIECIYAIKILQGPI